MRITSLVFAAALAAPVAAIGPASAAPMSCSQSITDPHSLPGSQTYTIHEHTNTCRRLMEAAAYCEFGGGGRKWKFGHQVRTGKSIAVCGSLTEEFLRWGFRTRIDGHEVYKQEGHH